jgi:hypothetical protein
MTTVAAVRRRAVAALVVAALVIAALSGCASETVRHGARPLVVCGTTLWSGAAGAVIVDATGRSASVNNVSSGNNIYLELVDGCQIGASISIPAAGAKILKVSHSHNGRLAAVVLRPRRNDFTVQVRRPDGSTTAVSVRLTTG